MLNIDSTRNRLKIVKVHFRMLRQCAHTHGTLGKTSYDFVACGTGIGNGMDCSRCWTMDEHIHVE